MDSLYEKIENWVLHSFGIQLQDHQKERIQRSLSSSSLLGEKGEERFIQLLYNKDQEAINSVTDAVTVQESYFFRDQSLFNLLRSIHLPALIEEKSQNFNYEIRVWSAGCSEGQEIYSIAMLLDQLIPDISRWKITLFATDINDRALNVARSGIYTKSSMRSTPDDIIQKYFTVNGNNFKIREDIKSYATFEKHNISSVPYHFNSFDFILCRNVFIYLSRSTIENCLKGFKSVLNENGKLYLGPSDIVSYIRNPLYHRSEGGVTYYVIKQPEILESSIENHPPDIVDNADKLKESRKQVVCSYADEQRMVNKKIEQIKAAIIDNPGLALHFIELYLNEHKVTPIIYQLKAESLFRLNDIDTALDFCNLCLKTDSINYHCHLMIAIIYFDKNDPKAEDEFRKTLIINKNSVESYFYLSRIALMKNNNERALACLRAVKNLLVDDVEYGDLFLFDRISKDKFIKEINSEIESLASGEKCEG